MTTLQAIKASIKHWGRVLDGKDKSIRGSDCALCRMYRMVCGLCPLGNAGMWCVTCPSPYRDVGILLKRTSNKNIPPPSQRSRAMNDAISVMYIALCLVYEAEKSEARPFVPECKLDRDCWGKHG